MNAQIAHRDRDCRGVRRRRLGALAACALLVSCTGSTTAPPPSTEGVFVQPTGARAYMGRSGWTMLTDPNWTDYDIVDFGEEVAWQTGGGDNSFPSNVNVFVDPQPAGLDLGTYVAANRKQFSLMQDGNVLSAQILTNPNGDKIGRIEYTATIGVPLHGVVYIVAQDMSFIDATLVTPPAVFQAEAPAVERYLASLDVP